MLGVKNCVDSSLQAESPFLSPGLTVPVSCDLGNAPGKIQTRDFRRAYFIFKVKKIIYIYIYIYIIPYTQTHGNSNLFSCPSVAHLVDPTLSTVVNLLFKVKPPNLPPTPITSYAEANYIRLPRAAILGAAALKG